MAKHNPQATEIQKTLTFEQRELRFKQANHVVIFPIDENGLVHLNPMWERVGRPANKEPWNWSRLPDGETSIDTASKNLNLGKSQVWKVKRGKHSGGTWAHWRIAIAYGIYLDPQAKYEVIEGFAKHAEEAADPGLKMDRAIDGYKKRGWDDKAIEVRIRQITNKKALDGTLKTHDVDHQGYPLCYDAFNIKILGGTSRECKHVLGLKDHEPLRDALDTVHNAAIDFAQILSREKIIRDNVRGNAPCQQVCAESGFHVSHAMTAMGVE